MMHEKNHNSALIVNEGVEQPPVVNPYIQNFYKKLFIKNTKPGLFRPMNMSKEFLPEIQQYSARQLL